MKAKQHLFVARTYDGREYRIYENEPFDHFCGACDSWEVAPSKWKFCAGTWNAITKFRLRPGQWAETTITLDLVEEDK